MDQSPTLGSQQSAPRPHFSIVNVPWNRRMQTLTVACFVAALPLSAICSIASLALLFVPGVNGLMLIYLFYIFFVDKSPNTGSRTSKWFRSLRWWTHFKDFFPIRLIKTEELPPDGKYIFGYHPHGIISFGALSSFATEGCGFSDLFPGIRVNLVTLATNMKIPFLREIWLSLGVCSADRKTFHNILSQGGGRAIAVVVGGAAESLKASPGTLDLYLNRRKGFVRQALLAEAALVPVLAFGETDVYGVFHWKSLEALQERMQKILGFAIPFFHGRGIFNYDFGIVPHRRPITVIVGKPIVLPTVDSQGRRIAEHKERWLLRDEEGKGLVDEFHGKYVEALQALYQEHKGRFFIDRVQSMRIE